MPAKLRSWCWPVGIAPSVWQPPQWQLSHGRRSREACLTLTLHRSRILCHRRSRLWGLRGDDLLRDRRECTCTDTRPLRGVLARCNLRILDHRSAGLCLDCCAHGREGSGVGNCCAGAGDLAHRRANSIPARCRSGCSSIGPQLGPGRRILDEPESLRLESATREPLTNRPGLCCPTSENAPGPHGTRCRFGDGARTRNGCSGACGGRSRHGNCGDRRGRRCNLL